MAPFPEREDSLGLGGEAPQQFPFNTSAMWLFDDHRLAVLIVLYRTGSLLRIEWPQVDRSKKKVLCVVHPT